MDDVASSVFCPQCGRSYRWKAEYAGKTGKCKCGERVEFPFDDPALDEADIPVAESVEDDVDAAGDDWLDQDSTIGVATDAPAVGVDDDPFAGPSHRCPTCQAAVKPTAKLCVQCGTDLSSGKRMSTKVKAAAVVGSGGLDGEPKRIGGVALFGTMALGGLVGALVGGGTWGLVAYVTDYQLGFLAWAVGLLAGLGTAMGAFGHSGVGMGLLASFFGFLGICFGKGLIAVFITIPMMHTELGGFFAEEDWSRSALLYQMEEDGTLPDEQQAMLDEWYEDDEVLELPEPLRAFADAELAALPAAERAEFDAMDQMAGGLTGVIAVIGGIVATFGLFDLIFIPLAIFTAFSSARKIAEAQS